VAAWYDRLVGDEGSDYHRHVILPTALRLLDVQPGERVLDLCCGQGVLTRLLAEKAAGLRVDDRGPQPQPPGKRPAPPSRGASGRPGASERAKGEEPVARRARIVGVDASARLIAAARSRGPVDPGIRYVVRDATQLGDLADGRFDAAACVMAVQDVEDLTGLSDQIARALRPGGRAVLVMMHPCFRVPRQSDWGWDEARKLQYRRVDRYLQPMQVPIATHPGSDPGQHTHFHHRPLKDYINALSAAGLAVIGAEEPVTHREPPHGPRHRGQKRSFEEIPVFLALKAVKLQPSPASDP